jgi:hypothetical protein
MHSWTARNYKSQLFYLGVASQSHHHRHVGAHRLANAITTTTIIAVEAVEALRARTGHHQWEAVRPVTGRGHLVEATEEAGEDGEDGAAMDTDQGHIRGQGAGRRVEVRQGRIADQCRGHHRQGEAMEGATLCRGEVDAVEVEVVAAAVEEARVMIRMEAGVHVTVAEAGTEDEKAGRQAGVTSSRMYDTQEMISTAVA